MGLLTRRSSEPGFPKVFTISMHSIATYFEGRRMLRMLAAATLCYWIVMTILMHMPLTPRLKKPGPGLPADKTVHFVLYGGLATALILTAEQRARVRPATFPKSRLVRYGLVFVFCTVHGYLEELTQPLTGRTYDLSDFVADCLGASVALVGCFVVGRIIAWRK